MTQAPTPGPLSKSLGQQAYEKIRDCNDNASKGMNDSTPWESLTPSRRRSWEDDARTRPHLYGLAPTAPVEASGSERESWTDLSCAEQMELATKIAANVGYVLTPEPDHPDCPHNRPQPSGETREGESVAVMRPFWVSWWGEPSTFELHRPWWVSGERDDGKQSICAAVLAQDEFSARMSVQWAHDDKDAVIEWRFSEEKPKGWSPFNDRFRQADWMIWPETARPLALVAQQGVSGFTPVVGLWKDQSLSRLERVKAHRSEFGSELKQAVEAVDEEASRQALLSARPLALGGQQGEEAAWSWLNQHVECDPADRDYSADEMVDAFMAGQSTTPARAEAQDEGAAGEPVAKVVRKGFSTGSISWTKFGQDADLSDETPLYAHPSPTPAADAQDEGAATDALVDRFAVALKAKLRAAGEKYGFDDAWRADDWRDKLIEDLWRHVQKGDPRDVAAYCAFAWHHQWSLSDEVFPRAGKNPYAPQDEEVAGERDIAGETLMGFRVAAWRYRQGEETDKLPHHYAEHWSTPGASAWGIQRLFTEDQLQQALARAHPSPTPAADADRVRIAVEALETAREDIVGWFEAIDAEVRVEHEMHVTLKDDLANIDQAIAALKSTAAKEGGEL